MHLKYSCIKSNISKYNYCAGIITNRAVNNLNVQMVFLRLESWTSQWHLPIRGVAYHEPRQFSLTSGASFHDISTSVVYFVFKWEQSSRDYLLSRSIPSGINLDSYSMHPAIKQIQQTQYQCNGGLNLWPCPWDLNLVIAWNTNNLSHHGWDYSCSSLQIKLKDEKLG